MARDFLNPRRLLALVSVLVGASPLVVAQGQRRSGEWRMRMACNPTAATSRGLKGGHTTLDRGGNNWLACGFIGTLRGYLGKVLQREDDETEPVTFEVPRPSKLNLYRLTTLS